MGTWWSDVEWRTLLAATPAGDPAEDQVRMPGPTTIRRGDLFALGPHRLLCGDATDAADVARVLGDVVPRLMTADAPYGVGYSPLWRHRACPHQRTAGGAVANDTEAAWPGAFQLFPGDVVYAWHAARATATVATTLESVGFTLRAQIIWVKQHFALSRGDYHWQHEPCWYAVRKGARSHWQGDRTQSTVWTVPILNHTAPGEAVYDRFVGSGTTIIAAAKTGRTAYAMDIDAQYVQVALTRWEQWTGQRATRVSRSNARRRS